MTDPIPLPLSIIRTVHGNDDCYTEKQMRAYAAEARAQALEDAARVCDPTNADRTDFWTVYAATKAECADAIRALKDKT